MLKHRCISAALLALALAGCQGRGLQPSNTSAASPATNDTIPTTTSEPARAEEQSSTTVETTSTTVEIIPETVPVTRVRATVPATTVRTAPVTTAVEERSGGGAGGTLACIRRYESGGDYDAVSPSGQYRGGYQFDYQTWASVGGSGDPAVAPPAEQDMRAQMLLDSRGLAPWPTPARICG